MGETMAQSLRDQIEIDKPIVCDNGFKDSISFGRFENDLLSWERWSSFSQNKYLEEVGKCSTPGSVAQKKAYFEAHYKKVAARKSEMEQEQESLRSVAPSSQNSNGCTKLDFDTLGVDGITRAMESDANSVSSNGNGANHDTVSINWHTSFDASDGEKVDDLPSSPKSNECNSAVQVTDENQSVESQRQSEDLVELITENNTSIILPTQSKQENVSVQEENYLIQSQDPSEQLHHKETRCAQDNKAEDPKAKQKKELQKKTRDPKDKNLVKTKKKQVAPTTKATHTSLPRTSKFAPPSPVVPVSKISTRKESSPSLTKSSPTAVKKKTLTTNSLHMSLTMESTTSNSDTQVTTTRRSFIMEKMGDKDIVKRAFKAFQNNFSISKPFAEEKSSTPQQVSTKRTARVASTSMSTPMTSQRDKERVKKAVENTSSQRRQVGVRANSVSDGRPGKGAGQHQTSTKAAPSSFVLNSDERVDRAKELSKPRRSNVKEVERPRPISQSKERKETEIKKLSQSLNLKASPMRDFQCGQRIPKPHGAKVDAADETYHQPTPHR